jgi:hypothetical protein
MNRRLKQTLKYIETRNLDINSLLYTNINNEIHYIFLDNTAHSLPGWNGFTGKHIKCSNDIDLKPYTYQEMIELYNFKKISKLFIKIYNISKS